MLRGAQVNFWLGALIQDRGDDLYRMKGVIAIRDFPETFVFQVSVTTPRLTSSDVLCSC